MNDKGVELVASTEEGVTLDIRMTFARRGMANMLDSWRTWLDQGKSAGGQSELGIQIPVDAVMRVLKAEERVLKGR